MHNEVASCIGAGMKGLIRSENIPVSEELLARHRNRQSTADGRWTFSTDYPHNASQPDRSFDLTENEQRQKRKITE